jgi:hypothetical protein
VLGEFEQDIEMLVAADVTNVVVSGDGFRGLSLEDLRVDMT